MLPWAEATLHVPLSLNQMGCSLGLKPKSSVWWGTGVMRSHLIASFSLQHTPIGLPYAGGLVDGAAHVCHSLGQTIQVCHGVQSASVLQLQAMLDTALLGTA